MNCREESEYLAQLRNPFLIIVKSFLQQLSEQELDSVRHLMSSETISRGNIDMMTSLNHDEEKQGRLR